MGACAQREIEEYEANNSGRFQTEIDEIAMGEFLVKTDTISSRELQEAQRIQMRGRQVLGEMLVAMGMASADEVDEVVNLQREIREHYRSGVKRLGDLLMAQNKVPAAKVDEAVQLQSIGRQPFGAILVALGACTTQDVMEALEIQQKWRSKARATGDRLGEALVKSGIISESALQGPLQRHMEEEKPLGRILIESKLCAPEQIIDTLIERDYHRQEEFCEYVRRQAAKRPSQPQAPESQVSGARPAYRDDIKPSIVGKLSSWISRAKEKDQP
jgi:hypothetical protein